MKAKTSETLLALFGTILFLLLLLPFFLIWVPYKILSSPEHIYLFDTGIFRYLGVVPIALGLVIYVWCSSSFVFYGKGTPIPFTPTKKLVVTGLYRIVRNPIYIAGSLVLAGEALLFQSIGIFIYCLVMFVIFNVHVLIEETLLADKFGATYEQYCKSVPRWIPRLKPYRIYDSEPK
jgi:protein-S-isoprenylcysteine O-methyltransferase Ste14